MTERADHTALVVYARQQGYECKVASLDRQDEVYYLRSVGDNSIRHTWYSWEACYAFLVGLGEESIKVE